MKEVLGFVKLIVPAYPKSTALVAVSICVLLGVSAGVAYFGRETPVQAYDRTHGLVGRTND